MAQLLGEAELLRDADTQPDTVPVKLPLGDTEGLADTLEVTQPVGDPLRDPDAVLLRVRVTLVVRLGEGVPELQRVPLTVPVVEGVALRVTRTTVVLGLPLTLPVTEAEREAEGEPVPQCVGVPEEQPELERLTVPLRLREGEGVWEGQRVVVTVMLELGESELEDVAEEHTELLRVLLTLGDLLLVVDADTVTETVVEMEGELVALRDPDLVPVAQGEALRVRVTVEETQGEPDEDTVLDSVEQGEALEEGLMEADPDSVLDGSALVEGLGLREAEPVLLRDIVREVQVVADTLRERVLVTVLLRVRVMVGEAEGLGETLLEDVARLLCEGLPVPDTHMV